MFSANRRVQQNPTERANRTIKTMVAQLPELNLAINSSVFDSTGFSPAFIIQGREPCRESGVAARSV